MMLGSRTIHPGERRLLRDVLGVVLVAVTALLYAAERPRADAAEAPAESETAVVVESMQDSDFLPTPAAFETGTVAPTLRPDRPG